MDARLETLLAKVVARGAASGLDPDELAWIDELLRPAAPDAPRPLWWFVRRQALLFRGVFPLDANRWISGIEQLLPDAGVPGPRPNPAAWLVAPVREADLRDAVRRNLTSTDTSRRACATLFVGLADLSDLVDSVVDGLASGRERRASYGEPVIASAIETLTRVRHPRARELALEHLSSPDHAVRQAIVPALLCAADQLSDADLGRVLQGDYPHELVIPFRAVFARAARAGILEAGVVHDLIVENTWNASRCLAGAELAHLADRADVIEQRLQSGDDGVATALLLRLVRRPGATADPFQERGLALLRAVSLDGLYGTTRAAAVLALASHAADPGPLVREQLDQSEEYGALGAVWACLGRDLGPAVTGALEARAAEPDPAFLRRAARFVLDHRRFPDAPELAEIGWQRQLCEEGWWTWQLGIDACAAAGVPVPPLVHLFDALADTGLPHGDPARLERTLDGFEREPWHLARWLDLRDVDVDQRTLAAMWAAQRPNPLWRSAVEGLLVAAEDPWRDGDLVLALAAMGGPQGRVADLRGRLFVAEPHEDLRVPPADRPALTALALVGKGDLGRRAVRALGGFPDAEDELLVLLSSADEAVADAAAAATIRVREPRVPLIADLGRLLGGAAKAVRELPTAAQIARCRAKAARQAFVELAGRPDNDPAEVAPLLFAAMADPDAEVAAAAVAAWAAHASGRPWLRALVTAVGDDDAWGAPTRAMSIMAQLADPAFLPYVGRALHSDEQKTDAALAAARRIGEVHPESGVLVIDAREPWRVRERFGLPYDELRHEAEAHGEALRLWMLGLSRRPAPAELPGWVGQRVMLTPLAGDLPAAGLVSSTLAESLLMHLTVVFADEESGAIVAEVAAEPTGEVLTALLQTRPVAAVVVSRS